MFNCRKEGVEKINKMFGLNVSVECNVDIENYNVYSSGEEPETPEDPEEGVKDNEKTD